ncbi:MAG: 30S ribosomal protein S8e [Nanoarchaeota archaeon]
MANSQFRSKRKVSGTKYNNIRKKRAMELAGVSALTNIGKQRVKIKRTRGGNIKKSLLVGENVCVNQNDKTIKLKILSVVNNPANINWTRRNIISKGCIVRTQKGDVRITSRPGQEGALFGVFI